MLKVGLSPHGVLELPGWSARMTMLGVGEDDDGSLFARLVSECAPPREHRFEGPVRLGDVVMLLPDVSFQVVSLSEEMVALDQSDKPSRRR